MFFVTQNSRNVQTSQGDISQDSTLTLTQRGVEFYEFEVSIRREIYEVDDSGDVHESQDFIYQNFPTSLEELEKIYDFLGVMLEKKNARS